MAPAASKSRLVADPCIGVGDLLQCVECYLDENGENCLQKLLQPPSTVGWKTAPNPAWLCQVSGLLRKYVAIAPNGVLPSKKHRIALEKLFEKRPSANGGKKTNQDYAEMCDEWIRIALAHLRSLRQCATSKSRCFRKCDPDEISKLEELLGRLTECEGEQTDDSQTSQTSGEQTLALVPKADASRPSVTAAPPTSEDPVNPLKIFEAVNSRRSILEESPDGKRVEKHLQGHGVPGNSLQFGGFLAGLVDIGAVDAKIVKDCHNQEPLNKGYSSQLQRANKAIKKKKDEETEECEDEHEHDDPATAEPSETLDKCEKGAGKKKAKEPKQGKKGKASPDKKKQVIKKPKNVKQAGNTGATKKKDKVEKPAAPLAMKSKKCKEKPETTGDEEQADMYYPDTPAGFDSSVNRAANRKRWTSRHWHCGYDEAARAGYDHEECCEAGRQSSQASSKEFEKLWPRPAKKGKKAKTNKGKNTKQKQEPSEASPVPAMPMKKKKKQGKKCPKKSTQGKKAKKAKKSCNEAEDEDENGTLVACDVSDDKDVD